MVISFGGLFIVAFLSLIVVCCFGVAAICSFVTVKTAPKMPPRIGSNTYTLKSTEMQNGSS